MEVRHPIVHENATLPLQAEIMPREGNNPMLENDDLRDTLAGPSQELSQNGGLTRVTRFEIPGGPTDIDEAIAYLPQAASLTLDDLSDKSSALENLGNLYAHRSHRLGELADIDSAIERMSQSGLPGGHPHRPGRLSDLGDLHTRRFERLGELADIDRSIESLSQAVSIALDDQLYMTEGLKRLGDSRLLQFERLGELADIDRAIECMSQSVLLTPDGHPDKPGRLSDLGDLHTRRFKRLDKLADIVRSIECLSQAVLLTSEGHPDKPPRLTELGRSHTHRFLRLGELSDIDRSIECLSQAVSLTPDDESYKRERLNSLGHSYTYRFLRLGELSDVDRSIECLSQVASLTPDGHSDKPSALGNLGNSYTRRFLHLGELSDIDRSIECLSQVTSLTPDGDSDKPSALRNLGNSYTRRFIHLGELSDIDRSIECLSQAVSLTPEGHSEKPSALGNLSSSYTRRFLYLGELSDIDRSIECLSQAVSLTPEGHSEKPAMLSELVKSQQRQLNRLGMSANMEQTTSFTPDSDAHSNLDNSHAHQFERLGETTDIDAQTAGLSQAASLAPYGQEGDSTGRVVEVVPSEMLVTEVFECLLKHGCVDISSNLDPAGYSSGPIGGGSFGDIWKGKLISGEKVAIKCLRFGTLEESQPKGLKRLMRETYMWSKIKHDNVQQLIGITMLQTRLGMVSLWREHGSVQDYIRKNPGVNRHQLCMQVTSGVSYLHSISMVHGDIKAPNILVSVDGIARLSDFDHSILSNCTLTFSATTNIGGGTLRWMAPELLLMTDDSSNKGVLRTTQTDVYALGMTMLEIFTGKVPYAEYKQDGAIYGAIAKKKPPARPEVLTSPKKHADEMWGLLKDCWNHNPVARPKSLSVLSSLRSLIVRPPPSI